MDQKGIKMRPKRQKIDKQGQGSVFKLNTTLPPQISPFLQNIPFGGKHLAELRAPLYREKSAK